MEILKDLIHWTGLPWWFRCWRICLQCGRPEVDAWVRKISCRREWLLTPVFLPEEFHGQRRLVGYSPWGHRDSDTTEWLTLWLFQESEIDLLCLLFLWRRKSFCLIYTSWVLIKGKPDFTFLSQKSDWQKCLFSFLSDLFHYLSDWDLVSWRGLEVLRA